MTQVQRLVRPDDVKEAASWYFGVSLTHQEGLRSSVRVSRAKWTYWIALTRLGMSYAEVSDVAGCTHTSVTRAMSHSPDLEPHICAVLARADEIATSEVE